MSGSLFSDAFLTSEGVFRAIQDAEDEHRTSPVAPSREVLLRKLKDRFPGLTDEELNRQAAEAVHEAHLNFQ